MKIIIGGATGLVGKEILEVLQELSPWVDDIVPVASERSAGKTLRFKDREYTIRTFEEALKSGAKYAIFSAGSGVSKQWADRYAKQGITVIDNSSAWRMKPGIPLIVPEVNAHSIKPTDRIIANPNCSTIQLVVALAPLHKKLIIKRIVVSTYQSVSGSGIGGLSQLEAERNQQKADTAVYPHPIDKNAIPHGGDFTDNAYTTEELKLIDETRKILDEPEMAITSTVVRIPVTGGHSESVNIEFERPFGMDEVRTLLQEQSHIVLEDAPGKNLYPMPVNVRKSNKTHIGRIRRDFSVKNGLNMWVVADNLRKGAATNAVQILNLLESKHP
ncbi:MAG: aspartate-semialdehyde dehydrogenase [Bacteroidales bacterium]